MCDRTGHGCPTEISLPMVMLKKRCAGNMAQRFDIAGLKYKIETILGEWRTSRWR
jgi:hypothetical protein